MSYFVEIWTENSHFQLEEEILHKSVTKKRERFSTAVTFDTLLSAIKLPEKFN